MSESSSSIRHVAVFAFLASSMAIMLPATEPVAQSGKASKGAKANSGPTRWEATIKKFEAIDATTPPLQGAGLLVDGSNALRWTDVGDYFPQHQVIKSR